MNVMEEIFEIPAVIPTIVKLGTAFNKLAVQITHKSVDTSTACLL